MVATPNGEGETPIGMVETPNGEDETPIGEDETPIRMVDTPIGEDETPIQMIAAPIGEDETPNGEDEMTKKNAITARTVMALLSRIDNLLQTYFIPW
jgi:hypothetical protein